MKERWERNNGFSITVYEVDRLLKRATVHVETEKFKSENEDAFLSLLSGRLEPDELIRRGFRKVV